MSRVRAMRKRYMLWSLERFGCVLTLRPALWMLSILGGAVYFFLHYFPLWAALIHLALMFGFLACGMVFAQPWDEWDREEREEEKAKVKAEIEAKYGD